MARNDIGKVMSKSYARSRVIGQTIELEEKCCVCERDIPEGRLVIRHRPTSKVICLLCMAALAEVE